MNTARLLPCLLALCSLSGVAALVTPAMAGDAADAAALAGQAMIVTTTLHVEDIAVSGDTLYVATRGGLEEYSLGKRVRQRLYTTLDGLATIHVEAVRVERAEGNRITVEARTHDHVCTLASGRFTCRRGKSRAASELEVFPRFADTRVTVKRSVPGGQLIGTAGRGLWLQEDGARPDAAVLLSPGNQVCANHVMAMAEFAGKLYLGGFDEGLCVHENGTYRRIEGPFRMINALAATPAGLYIADNSGLFFAADGEHFARVDYVTERGVNGLALDGNTLWATSPATLWRIPIDGGPGRRQFWRPGGSRAIQRVHVTDGVVWMAAEDRGVIRYAGQDFEVFDRAAGLPTSWVMDVLAMPGANGVTTVYAATFRDGLVAIDFTVTTASGPAKPARPAGPARRKRGKAAASPVTTVAAIAAVRRMTGLPDGWLLSVSEKDGALWVGSQGGAARVAPGQDTVAITAGLPHPSVHAIVHHGGKVWLATEGGLFVLSDRM